MLRANDKRDKAVVSECTMIEILVYGDDGCWLFDWFSDYFGISWN